MELQPIGKWLPHTYVTEAGREWWQYRAGATLEDSLLGGAVYTFDQEDLHLISGYSWLHAQAHQEEYLVMAATVAELRTFDIWSQSMENIWRCGHVPDGGARGFDYSGVTALIKLYGLLLQSELHSRPNIKEVFLYNRATWLSLTRDLRMNLKTSLLRYKDTEIFLRPIEETAYEVRKAYGETLAKPSVHKNTLAAWKEISHDYHYLPGLQRDWTETDSLEAFGNRAFINMWSYSYPAAHLVKHIQTIPLVIGRITVSAKDYETHSRRKDLPPEGMEPQMIC